jgi:CheY-like chemotaxis protein
MTEENRKRVLIVDDDPDVREVVGLSLERGGMRVFLAEDGEEGLAAAHKEEPDLIVLDVLMPKKDGLTTYEDLLKDKKLAAIPVVMLTSVSDKVGFGFSADTMKEYFGKRPAAYLEKPVDPEKLVKTVKNLLGIWD